MLHLANFLCKIICILKLTINYTIASNILDMTLQQQKHDYYLSYTFHYVGVGTGFHSTVVDFRLMQTTILLQN